MTYAYPPTAYATYDGPPGRVRPTGTSILLFVVTFGIYGLVYNYQVHDEMKRHSGRGLGGGLALLLTFLAGIAMPFLTPNEVGNLYTRKNHKAPVNAWTGLWSVLPHVLGMVAVFISVIAMFASAPTDPVTGEIGDPSGAAVAGLLVAMLVYLVAYVAGGIIWFVKTNGALNDYWRTVTVTR